MTNFRKSLLATAVALTAGSALALPVFTAGTNSIEFQTIENQYRSDAACALNPSLCLAADASTPTGFKRVNPAGVGNLAVGDVFAGIMYVTGILPAFVPPGEFTGYFAQRVASIDLTDINNSVIKFGTVTVDPFGKLGAGEMFRLYTDATPDFNPAGGGTTFQTIDRVTNATGGLFWGSLGLGSEGFAYTVDDLTVSGNNVNFQAKTFLALDVINKGVTYNLGPLNKVNDQSESPFGGITALGGLLCDAADLANPLVVCTDFAGNADIKRNTQFATGQSPWYYRANDPLSLNVIPEPGSLALMGLALAGLGLARRRRSV